MINRRTLYIFAITIVASAIVATVILDAAGVINLGGASSQKVRIVYTTAGDINMLALMQNVLGPMFTGKHPEVELVTIHTGPGESGSRLIFEKLKAARDAGRECWDIDVAVVHQIFMSWALPEGLLSKYAHELSTWRYVASEHAKYALGVSIEGYAVPLFHSQIAVAYNPRYVPNPPRTYRELVEWVKQNPGRFGYNGIKGGMSGVGFVVGWVYWRTGEYEKLTRGPYDESLLERVKEALNELKEFNRHIVITAGNVGTLDMLAREEIWMGPVWVDMFYTWVAEGRMPPHIRLYILEPGLPGQPMYLVVPAKACNPEWAKRLVEFVSDPEIQAKVIVEKYNWYPGIDGGYVFPHVSEEARQRLFSEISPEILARYGRMFPLSQYFQAILKLYEEIVG